MDQTDQSKHTSSNGLDTRVEQSLQTCYESLLKSGQLLTKERLAECYGLFRERFGPEKLASLDGDVLLNTIHGRDEQKDSLVYWLEFKNDAEFPTRQFGSISGGSALKFGLYKSKDSGEWMAGHPTNQITLPIVEAIATARKHRDQLVAAVAVIQDLPAGADDQTYLTLQKKLNQVAPDVCDVAWGHKYLYLLFPEKLDDYHVDIYQRHHLIKLLLPPVSPTGLFSTAGQFIRLANQLGWPVNHLTTVLSERDGNPVKYWRVGTKLGEWDEAQDIWPEMKAGGYAAIGWGELGDLSSVLTDKDAKAKITAMFGKEYPNRTANVASRKAGEVRNFAKEISENDVILAADGTRIRGVGVVKGPYQFYSTNPEEAPHRRQVEWHDCSQWKMPVSEGLRTTVCRLKDDVGALIEAEKYLLETVMKSETTHTLSAPLNQFFTSFETVASNIILYGPPGTGKTYQTIERAVQIIEPEFTGDHAAYKARFDALRAKGQIEFITFHQSYSYEDFVEGLRPVIEGPESSEAAYEYSSGVFKRFAYEALFDCLKPTSGIVSFDAVWQKLVEQTELEPDKQYPGLSEKTSYRINLSTKGNLEGINTISNKTFLCSRSVLEKVFVAKHENEKVSSSEVMEVVVRGCHSHFVAAMFNELKKIEKSEFSGKGSSTGGLISLEQKESVAQAFLKKHAPGPDALKPANEWPRYVLVIDEINRGNISKILGELITLIEPDKRLGAENSLVVMLPYTKHLFAVPGNLHIVGTMNTADKSIALVDVALRRRFQFEELRPNFDLCQQLTRPMREMLAALNLRICLRKDRDHQIGHSYFIKVADESGFNHVFARHVIPLLQEYFYNDWEGLRYVLGEKHKENNLIIPLKDGDSRSSWQWSFEVGTNDANKVNFLQLLGGQELAT